MRSSELFIYLLLVFGWVIFMVVQRMLKPPKPLGTIEDEGVPPAAGEAEATTGAAPASPWDVDWGRTPDAPPVPIAVARQRPGPEPSEPSAWSQGPAQAELDIARRLGRRQAAARTAILATPRRRHPHRPRLRTHRELRAAVVMAAVIGPCRAMDAWRAPDDRP